MEYSNTRLWSGTQSMAGRSCAGAEGPVDTETQTYRAETIDPSTRSAFNESLAASVSAFQAFQWMG